MKRVAFIVLFAAFIVLILALGLPTRANAVSSETPPPPVPTATPTAKPPVAEKWLTGTEFQLNPSIYPLPNDWSQLMSAGVKVTEPGRICRPFRNGRFGWVGQIYRWSGTDWQKIETTLAWIPDKEGTYTACAVAPSAGVYAIYGYYDPSSLGK